MSTTNNTDPFKSSSYQNREEKNTNIEAELMNSTVYSGSSYSTLEIICEENEEIKTEYDNLKNSLNELDELRGTNSSSNAYIENQQQVFNDIYNSSIEEMKNTYYNNKNEQEALLNSSSQNNSITEVSTYSSTSSNMTTNIQQASRLSSAVQKVFGSNWNGYFPSVENELIDMATSLSNESQDIEIILVLAATNTAVSELMQTSFAQNVLQKMQQLETGINNFTNVFSLATANINNFSSVFQNANFSSPENAFSTIEGVLTNLDSVLDTGTELVKSVEYANNLYEEWFGSSNGKTNLIEDFSDRMERMWNTFTNKLDNIWKKVSDISKWPDAILEGIMSLPIVSRLTTLYNNVVNQIANITSIITSISKVNITCFSDVFSLLKMLKNIISSAMSIVNAIKRAYNEVASLYKDISNGNIISAVQRIGIIGGGYGTSFCGKVNKFAANYPYNNSATSSSGHIVELDDSSEAPRIKFQHACGSSMEFAHNGDVTLKSKSDYQLNCSKKLQFHANTTMIQSDKDMEIEAKDLKLTGSNSITLSTKDLILNADTTSNMGISNRNCGGLASSVGSLGGSSISSVGPVTISSNTSVIIDAPLIQIGLLPSDHPCVNLNLVSAGIISTASALQTAIVSVGGTGIGSTKMVGVIAPLITLN